MGHPVGLDRDDPAVRAEVVDVVTSRSRHAEPAYVEWHLLDRDYWPGLRLLGVREEDRLIGVGWLGQGTGNTVGWATEHVAVRSDHARRGVGTALHRALTSSLPDGTTQVRGEVDDDCDDALPAVRRWGFEPEQLSIRSVLDLTDLRPQPAPDGVTFEESPDLRFADQDCVEEMLRVSQTNPEAKRGSVRTLAQLASGMGSGDAAIGLLARVDGAPAALCVGLVADGVFHVFYTGVDPRFRGRGLAVAVKGTAHAVAAAAGARQASTENEEHNHGIRRVNAELGYVRQVGSHRVRLDV
ncbi:GNAT family N-acetyltransferase [uncultured Nocardioides sp.]|uniref:GNAT family N-acetyltransferase n=1 Tax=uncultured Nocardioides sp. TaxID=198441 RepID=UPI002628CAA1|nr:GNAT family N-acetyltransferase [uncultured Nocardioides sp.]